MVLSMYRVNWGVVFILTQVEGEQGGGVKPSPSCAL